MFDPRVEQNLAVVVPDVLDLVEAAELKRAVLVDGRSHVLAVVAVLDHLEAALTRHVRQTRLDLRQIGHFYRLSPFNRQSLVSFFF